MPQIVLACPHCQAERIGFTPRGAVPVRPGVNFSNLFLQCEGCGQGVVAVVEGPPGQVTLWMQGTQGKPGKITRIHPRPIEPSCPADVPDNVRSAFLSGLRNL